MLQPLTLKKIEDSLTVSMNECKGENIHEASALTQYNAFHDFDLVSICQLFGFKKKKAKYSRNTNNLYQYVICIEEATSVPLKIATCATFR